MSRAIFVCLALALGISVSFSAAAQVKIGVAGPMSGQNAGYGLEMRNGVDQAVEDINATGGINGQKLQIVIGDDVSDPKQGVSVANKFAAEGVKFVVGHFNSGISVLASQVYEEAGIVQVTPASTTPQLTELGSQYTFRTIGRDDQQGAIAGAFLAYVMYDKKVAILHDGSPYGKLLADQARSTMNAKGGKEVIYGSTSQVSSSTLTSHGVDMVYFGGGAREAGFLLREMRDRGMQTQMLSSDALLHSADFVRIIGQAYVGTLVTSPIDFRENSDAKDVIARFKRRNIDPGEYSLRSYASVQVLAEAAKQAGTVEGRKVADVMHSGKLFKTVIGDLSFDSKGDIIRPDFAIYTLGKGHDGRPEIQKTNVTCPTGCPCKNGGCSKNCCPASGSKLPW